MIAAVYTQNKGYEVRERPLPEIGPGELLLRVMASSICGTDLRTIRAGHGKLADGQEIVLGHEFAGVIEQAGSEVRAFRVGQRIGVAPNIGCGKCPMCKRALYNMCSDYTAYGITFDGGHAMYVRIPAASIEQGSVVELPANLSFIEASVIEPLSCVVNGARSVNVSQGDYVVIFGTGPIGLLHVMLARSLGARGVMAVDVAAHRRAKAVEVGADIGVDPTSQDVRQAILDATGGRGADVIITACSVPAVQEQSINMLAPFGRVCFFGGLPKDKPMIQLNSNIIHYKNLLVTGMTGGAPQDFRQALELVQTGKVNVRQVISHVFGQLDMKQAFEVAMTQETMKVVIAEDSSVPAAKAGT